MTINARINKEMKLFSFMGLISKEDTIYPYERIIRMYKVYILYTSEKATILSLIREDYNNIDILDYYICI